MPRRCSVLGCKSNYDKFLLTNKPVPMFTFPRDPVMLSKWLKVIPRKYKKITNATSVCENHFDPADIARSSIRDTRTKGSTESPVVLPLKKKYLKKDVVPCKFPEGNWSHECCVRFCRSNQKTCRTFRVFPFPKDPPTRRRWLRVMALKGIKVTPDSKVCERHFAQEEILTRQGESSAFLAKSAIPKIQENQCIYISAVPPPAATESAQPKLDARNDWDPLDHRFPDEIPFDMQVCDMDGKPLGFFSDGSGRLSGGNLFRGRHQTDQNSLLNNFKTLQEIMNRDYDEIELKKESMIESLKTIRLELDRVKTHDEYFVCRICDTAYGSRQTMERHKAFHVQVKCETEMIISDIVKKTGEAVENSMNFGTIKAFHNGNSGENDVEIDKTRGVAVGISIDFNNRVEDVPVEVPRHSIYDTNINSSSAGLCKMIRLELEKRRLAIENIKKSVAEIEQIDRKIERLTSRVIESQKIAPINGESAAVNKTQTGVVGPVLGNLQRNLESPVKSDSCSFATSNLEQMDNEDNAESISSELLEKHKIELENELRDASENDGDACSDFIDARPVKVIIKRARKVKDVLACQFCDYRSKTDWSLRSHERQVHSEEEIFECKICQYKGNLKSLALHKKLHKVLFCNDFDCKFSTKSHNARRRHMIYVHGETPKFKCGICGQVCLTKNMFKTHVMKHTGEKPLRCPHCDYRCRTQSDMCLHVKKHTVGRSYLCDICGAGFWDGSNLTTHKKRHFTGEVQCKLCPYKSISAAHIKMHSLKHVSESPFRCNFCNFNCESAGDLKNHQKTHTVPAAVPPKKSIRIRLKIIKKKQPDPE